jgi:pimeloyl-ACP methyl ester carboxylesterase
MVRAGGDRRRAVLLLHGLGATADVWDADVLDEHVDGPWVAPDLPGTGHRRR